MKDGGKNLKDSLINLHYIFFAPGGVRITVQENKLNDTEDFG